MVHIVNVKNKCKNFKQLNITCCLKKLDLILGCNAIINIVGIVTARLSDSYIVSHGDMKR